jgi:OOP family OmpA-OmpF porin
MTHPYRALALAAALLTLSPMAFAQASSMNMVIEPGALNAPYLVDSSRAIVHNNFGQCWRTGFWTVEAANATRVVGQPFSAGCYCDGDVMPQGSCQAKAAVILEMPPTAAVPAPAPAPTPAVATAEKATLATDTLFDFDRAVVTPVGKDRLKAYTEQLKTVNLEVVTVTGHTDRIGTERYNQALSERRAEAIKAFLVTQGVDVARLYVEARGESEPVTAGQCQNMGPERAGNHALIACLAPDRRVILEAVGSRR